MPSCLLYRGRASPFSAYRPGKPGHFDLTRRKPLLRDYSRAAHARYNFSCGAIKPYPVLPCRRRATRRGGDSILRDFHIASRAHRHPAAPLLAVISALPPRVPACNACWPNGKRLGRFIFQRRVVRRGASAAGHETRALAQRACAPTSFRGCAPCSSSDQTATLLAWMLPGFRIARCSVGGGRCKEVQRFQAAVIISL